MGSFFYVHALAWISITTEAHSCESSLVSSPRTHTPPKFILAFWFIHQHESMQRGTVSWHRGRSTIFSVCRLQRAERCLCFFVSLIKTKIHFCSTPTALSTQISRLKQWGTEESKTNGDCLAHSMLVVSLLCFVRLEEGHSSRLSLSLFKGSSCHAELFFLLPTHIQGRLLGSKQRAGESIYLVVRFVRRVWIHVVFVRESWGGNKNIELKICFYGMQIFVFISKTWKYNLFIV